MTIFSLILKNIWCAKIRTLLTMLGIALGVATIVVFGLLTAGMLGSISDVLRPGTADFTVAKAGSADIVLSFLNESQVETIQATEGVSRVAPMLFTITALEQNPYFLVYGLSPESLDMMGIHIAEGAFHGTPNEVVIGKMAARNLGYDIGDTIRLQDRPYSITGIFESGSTWQDAGAIASIAEAGRMQGMSGQVNMVAVSVDEHYDIREVANAVEARDRELVAVVDPTDYQTVDEGARITQAFSWAISLLAIAIGGIGVMNTIIMSVFERTREIGVLRAIGWPRRQIAYMVIGESLVIGLIATLPGIAGAIATLWLLRQTQLGSAWLTIEYDPAVFLQAVTVSLAVVLAGSIYPAWRASRLAPVEALRYE